MNKPEKGETPLKVCLNCYTLVPLAYKLCLVCAKPFNQAKYYAEQEKKESK